MSRRQLLVITSAAIALSLISYSVYRGLTHKVAAINSNSSSAPSEEIPTTTSTPLNATPDATNPTPSPETPPSQDSTDLVTVTRVIDGDTIEIEGGQKVRYIGINTPESVDPRRPVQCFGVEASNLNKNLVEGKKVRLEKDISETDKYGRLLRYVWLGDTLINDYLVRSGFAQAYSYPPDILYSQEFTAAQTEARDAGRGLWSSCSSPTAPVTQPSSKSPQAPPNPNCTIKGNITTSGKIYHLPGQRYYDQTTIDEGAGERWFCTEADAQAAGWRRSKL